MGRFEALLALASLTALVSIRGNDQRNPTTASRWANISVVAQHRYTISAAIRFLPLPFGWIGRDDVGDGIFTTRASGETRILELLIGSDPARAPLKINRWGYIAEELRGSQASVTGAMKRSNEQSIEEASSKVTREGRATAFLYDVIHASVTNGEARAEVRTIPVETDLTYRDIDKLLAVVDGGSSSYSQPPRLLRLPPGTRPGFLVALTELIHASVDGYRRSGRGVAPSTRQSVTYVYNGRLYELSQREITLLRSARFGNRSYSNVVSGEFELQRLPSGPKTRFRIAYGTDGPLAEVPVYATFSPRWWLRIELTLDDRI